MNDTPTPSPFATDGQRTTDAECWMNYCLEAEKGLATVTEQRDRLAEACDQYSEDEILCKLQTITEQRDRLAEAVNAATILIAAKGRHNTMLAYNGLRDALHSRTNQNYEHTTNTRIR
jgi:hypothetical protein